MIYVIASQESGHLAAIPDWVASVRGPYCHLVAAWTCHFLSTWWIRTPAKITQLPSLGTKRMWWARETRVRTERFLNFPMYLGPGVQRDARSSRIELSPIIGWLTAALVTHFSVSFPVAVCEQWTREKEKEKMRGNERQTMNSGSTTLVR